MTHVHEFFWWVKYASYLICTHQMVQILGMLFELVVLGFLVF
jgi:hypothetical protein